VSQVLPLPEGEIPAQPDRQLEPLEYQVNGGNRFLGTHTFPSLVLMLLPAVGLGALYAYNTTFAQYTLVAAVTYLFSVIAMVILPLRKPDLWYASAASKIKVLGVPVVPVAGVITIALLVYNLYEWLSNGTYGVNHKGVAVLVPVRRSGGFGRRDQLNGTPVSCIAGGCECQT
jgi:hypothetical protein